MASSSFLAARFIAAHFAPGSSGPTLRATARQWRSGDAQIVHGVGIEAFLDFLGFIENALHPVFEIPMRFLRLWQHVWRASFSGGPTHVRWFDALVAVAGRYSGRLRGRHWRGGWFAHAAWRRSAASAFSFEVSACSRPRVRM